MSLRFTTRRKQNSKKYVPKKTLHESSARQESSGLQQFPNTFPPAGRKTKDKRKIENQEQKDQLELQTGGIPPREEGSRKPHTTEKLHLGP
jgi:hypothetical protein